MICNRFTPALDVSDFIREYVLLHVWFSDTANIPVKSYPVNPGEGVIFLIKGSLHAESPDLGTMHKRPPVFVYGVPSSRQNLFISQEYLMLKIRLQSGALFKLTGIPMTELVHNYVDAELILGKEISVVYQQLQEATDYQNMIRIVENYLRNKISKLKTNEHPFDKIGTLILSDPQGFSLKKTAGEACLSYRQFERKFLQQIGIPAKHFSRICRFIHAYELKDTKPNLDWLSVAVRTGYSNYQHLVKDFKQFAGTTPTIFIEKCKENPERILKISNNFVL